MKGFTLLELLLATTLLILVLLLTGQVLLESQRMLLRTSAELISTAPLDLTASLLRADVQQARSGSSTFLWSSDPLVVSGPRSVRYAWTGSTLERALYDSSGDLTGARTLLQRVVAWRWRSPQAGLFDVEIVLEVDQAPRGAQLVERGRSTRTVRRRIDLRIAMRGAGGFSW